MMSSLSRAIISQLRACFSGCRLWEENSCYMTLVKARFVVVFLFLVLEKETSVLCLFLAPQSPQGEWHFVPLQSERSQTLQPACPKLGSSHQNHLNEQHSRLEEKYTLIEFFKNFSFESVHRCLLWAENFFTLMVRLQDVENKDYVYKDIILLCNDICLNPLFILWLFQILGTI